MVSQIVLTVPQIAIIIPQIALTVSHIANGIAVGITALCMQAMRPRCKKSKRGPGLGELPKIWGYPFNISAMAEASQLQVWYTALGFAKAHHKIPHRRKSGGGPVQLELPKILRFPFNICATAKASNFKFGIPLGFAKAHHKTTPRGKVGQALGSVSSQIFQFSISATAALST